MDLVVEWWNELREFVEAHAWETAIGGVLLLCIIQLGNLSTREDKRRIAVAGQSGKYEWDEHQELAIQIQVGIETRLEKIEIALGAILMVLAILVFRFI